MPNHIWIGLGSNLGNSREHLNQAVTLIAGSLAGKIKASSLYRSEPVEFGDQPWFINQVIRCETAEPIGPRKVLRLLKEIELRMGRVPTFRYGPRIIDLDILFYNDWVLETAELVIPHPKIPERSFVLIPLVELDPNLIHPRLRRSVASILACSPHLSRCQKLTRKP
ncbi:MAG: 2-amino-4-hydroxy-6-hydroxymethyldihydropteridine diphosphokinase [Firmicutes bacterium]|nr:2-amino-4-hydroxy-6-hydroxymethyldihydropteridine diphosphokinase [Bacillota bacterium]